jgi:hypothetical protein
MVGCELCELSRCPTEDVLNLVGDPCCVAFGGEGECLGIHVRDQGGCSSLDQGVFVLIRGGVAIFDRAAGRMP